MRKLIILVGPSNSGKSTYAHSRWLNDPKNVIIVSRDYIRYQFGYCESTVHKYYERSDINYLEEQVSVTHELLVKYWLSQNKTVICDNTHLSAKTIRPYVHCGAEIETIYFDVTLEEALERNSKRVRKVSGEVIRKQIEKYINFKKNHES